MTSLFRRGLSALRIALGAHDPNRAPVTPPHGWLLPPTPTQPDVTPRS